MVGYCLTGLSLNFSNDELTLRLEMPSKLSQHRFALFTAILTENIASSRTPYLMSGYGDAIGKLSCAVLFEAFQRDNKNGVRPLVLRLLPPLHEPASLIQHLNPRLRRQ